MANKINFSREFLAHCTYLQNYISSDERMQSTTKIGNNEFEHSDTSARKLYLITVVLYTGARNLYNKIRL